MRIVIDISQVVYGTGVSTYIRNLVRNLLAIDKENEYILFGGSLRRKDELNDFLDTLKGESFMGKTFPLTPTLADIIWNKLHILPIEIFIGKVDVLHSSDWAQPPSSAFKVTTVHDLVPFKFPELSHPRIVSVHKARLKWVKKEVDSVIVPSETTKADLAQLGIDFDKITVIPEAPDPIFKRVSASKVTLVKKKYDLSREYLLSVGVNPRKNTKRIIKAFQKIRKHGQYKDLSLAIIGHPYMEVEETEGVKILGHVSESDKPALFSGSKVLVYPSLYEGFGLPILEAFKCKIPVVTSNLGSLKEVAGDAAILVEPGNSNSISAGITKALTDRETLIQKGVKRVKNYSWEKTAKATLKIYAKTN
ncbi:glycosyltransferase family 4 protein [Patescibacteria group bacterium]|nr:glycosyltransferase family 4 protein [Patescibacteria group bacterium]